MKQRLLNNIGLKLLSLFLAFICWLVIINISDPTITRVFYDIPVEILNESVIASADYVYEVVDGDTVDVTVKGKRSIVERIKKEDFAAKADLSKLSKVNAVAIDVVLSSSEAGELDIEWNNAVLQVSLEKKKTQTFQVTYKKEGELDASYVADEVSIETPVLRVSGGESTMKRIASVGVVVMLDHQTEDFVKELSPVLYDEAGQVVSAENVTFDTDLIKVRVKVFPTKSIPVYFDVTGEPKDGYRVVQTDFQPESIYVAGSSAELEELMSLTLPLDVEGKSKDIEMEIDVAAYLRESLRVVEGYETISVRCVIEKNGKRTLSLTSGDIKTINMPENMTCVFNEQETKYAVKITGAEDVVKDITNASIGPYLDLSGLTAGTYELPLQFKLPEGVKTKTKIKISLTLEKSASSDEEEPTDTPVIESEEE